MSSADRTPLPFGEALLRAKPNTEDMVVVHRMFRREIPVLGAAVSRVAPADTTAARRVESRANLVLNFLVNHHHGEDELLWPLLKARSDLNTELVGLMEVQHHEMDAILTDLRAHLPAWAKTADSGTRDILYALFTQLKEILNVHLDAEERLILPLVRETLTVPEWERLGKHGAAATPRNPMSALMLLGAILEDSDTGERQRFLATVPLPARLAWSVVGRRRYLRYAADLRR